jgi:hypothetical protein
LWVWCVETWTPEVPLMPHPTRDPHGRPRLRLIEGERCGEPAGRHALDEEAMLTPIFATLARRRGRPGAPVDPVDRVRHDQLTAPLPVVVPARRRPGAHARPDPLPERPAPGRHALRRGAPSWLPH